MTYLLQSTSGSNIIKTVYLLQTANAAVFRLVNVNYILVHNQSHNNILHQLCGVMVADDIKQCHIIQIDTCSSDALKYLLFRQ